LLKRELSKNEESIFCFGEKSVIARRGSLFLEETKTFLSASFEKACRIFEKANGEWKRNALFVSNFLLLTRARRARDLKSFFLRRVKKRREKR
jgi:hypothetical protein